MNVSHHRTAVSLSTTGVLFGPTAITACAPEPGRAQSGFEQFLALILGILTALLLTLATAVGSCGNSGSGNSGAGTTAEGSDPSTTQSDDQPEAEASAEFTLYVSNQSFDDPSVQITITIDDDVAVDQDFAVEGQHNWITFEPDIAPGDHTLRAVSNTGAEFTTEFTIPKGEPRWTVVDYWFYPDEGPRHFTFNISDESIGFA